MEFDDPVFCIPTGTLEPLAPQMREYAQRAGIAVIGIDYTRAPDARFPQPLDESVDVVR